MLRSFVQQARNDTWDEMLPQCLMADRCTIHRSTGETSVMMTLGYEMRLPFDTQLPQSQQAMLEVSPFLARKMLLQKETLQLARQHLREQHINQARFYDREAFGAPFQPGDQVWLQNFTPTAGLSRKFRRPWMGPFTVMQCLPNKVYRITSAAMGLHRPLTLHFNRLKAVRQPVEEVSGDMIPEEEILV